LHRLSAIARSMRRPVFSYSQPAMLRLAPSQMPQVHSECWLESPVAWMAASVGSYEASRKALSTGKAQASSTR
jgi:hypothetical protein